MNKGSPTANIKVAATILFVFACVINYSSNLLPLKFIPVL